VPFVRAIHNAQTIIPRYQLTIVGSLIVKSNIYLPLLASTRNGSHHSNSTPSSCRSGPRPSRAPCPLLRARRIGRVPRRPRRSSPMFPSTDNSAPRPLHRLTERYLPGAREVALVPDDKNERRRAGDLDKRADPARGPGERLPARDSADREGGGRLPVVAGVSARERSPPAGSRTCISNAPAPSSAVASKCQFAPTVACWSALKGCSVAVDTSGVSPTEAPPIRPRGQGIDASEKAGQSNSVQKFPSVPRTKLIRPKVIPAKSPSGERSAAAPIEAHPHLSGDRSERSWRFERRKLQM
jgi:hypothetical protein